MRLVFLLLLSLLGGASVPKPPVIHVTFSPLTKAAYLQAQKGRIITKPRVTFPLKKQRGRIIIPLAKGQKVFLDTIIDEAAVKKGHNEDESTSYTYLGYLPDFKCHWLKINYYETSEYLLLDATGRQVKLWGEPIFSPDKQQIVASSMGIEYAGGQPNKIQLVRLQDGILREVWTQEPTTWEPYRICWLSATTLLLSKEMWTGKNPGSTFTYARLTIQ